MNERNFLSDQAARPWTPEFKHGFRSMGLYVGSGTNAIEVAVATANCQPVRSALIECWRSRRGRRAAPVPHAILDPGGAALCGATGEQPPVYSDLGTGRVERLCREALGQPDRHAALRFLSQALPSLETTIPGINNEGLLALHELQRGVPKRTDWKKAGRERFLR